jgi:hypothetical protein
MLKSVTVARPEFCPHSPLSSIGPIQQEAMNLSWVSRPVLRALVLPEIRVLEPE